ncbi:hypothetical protein A3K86_02945 [Photobacterium jeanii]|uniref:DUF3861 domain-containing protein n=1 Tax=Photobacterium jeanii TaxID=858640 RepID=A0A178KKY4_9GAMM|nr:DUF3861 domain-containing protein [Photobacterium jeanii]OAN17890.1 hypothetical protein A3K86_02945 [Photobacterium jeanii]PST92443.1 DUF3861 domain-containing protein [Photobacterium jeanii]
MRKENQYRITVEEIGVAEGLVPQRLQFEMQDREDLFSAVEKINENSGLAAPEATRVAVALRLLGPVMMLNRKHELFAEFMPHFKTFMQNLKNTVKGKR